MEKTQNFCQFNNKLTGVECSDEVSEASLDNHMDLNLNPAHFLSPCNANHPPRQVWEVQFQVHNWDLDISNLPGSFAPSESAWARQMTRLAVPYRCHSPFPWQLCRFCGDSTGETKGVFKLHVSQHTELIFELVTIIWNWRDWIERSKFSALLRI
jgi:hypothetical protein